MTNKNKGDILSEVKSLFGTYLKKHNYRKTPERFFILEEIYSREDHFDAESLYIQMKNNVYTVSRATIYNTLELLTNCDLIIKHQFGKNLAQYEKSYGSKMHDHVICIECGKVTEFCDPRIQQTKDMVTDILKFKVLHHSLHLYGLCKECQKTFDELTDKNNN